MRLGGGGSTEREGIVPPYRVSGRPLSASPTVRPLNPVPMTTLADAVISHQEKRLGAPLDYLRTIADTSASAFVKMAAFAPLAQHRVETPPAVWHLARLAATVGQDCGTCVQIVVNQARADGVAAATLRAALDGDTPHLDDGERLALRFGRAVAGGEGARQAGVDVQGWFGETVRVELALAVATAQVFPVLKRGLGQDLACALVTVDV